MRLDRDLGGWSCLVSADTAGGAVGSAQHGKSNLMRSGEQLGLRELVAAIATSAGAELSRAEETSRGGIWSNVDQIGQNRLGWVGWLRLRK